MVWRYTILVLLREIFREGVGTSPPPRIKPSARPWFLPPLGDSACDKSVSHSSETLKFPKNMAHPNVQCTLYTCMWQKTTFSRDKSYMIRSAIYCKKNEPYNNHFGPFKVLQSTCVRGLPTLFRKTACIQQSYILGQIWPLVFFCNFNALHTYVM